MKKLCSVFFCIVLGVISITMAIPIVENVLEQVTGQPESVRVIKEYDGNEDFPLENNTEVLVKEKKNSASRLFEAVKISLEKRTTELYTNRMNFVLLKKTWDKFLGIDMTTSLSTSDENPVVDLGNGRLSYIIDEFSATDKDNVNNLIEFGKQVEEKGMNFLLFCSPFKITNGDKIQSGIYSDASFEAEREYIQMVRDAGLSVVSATEAIEEQKLCKEDLFFKTDHHWLPQTALWGNRLLCEYLNENMGFSIDTNILSEDKYTITYADEECLGSQGKKVTEVFCEPEPFPIIIPRYDSDVTAFVSSKNDTLSGRIEDVLLNWSALEEPDIYKKVSYDLYSYGERALISIHNNKLNDGRKILLVKRSFADPMIPFLAACVENLDAIDLRMFNGSLQAYIDETKPDTVIAVYGVGSVAAEGSYDFR